MTDTVPKRLIEVAFPLKQTSIDAAHEKSVRHGHVSTLHIWPARRPLAAARAVLAATLLPDPVDRKQRDAILERLGGRLKQVPKKKRMSDGRMREIDDWETEGGILHWGRESDPDLEWFRKEIRKKYGGRRPKVLDPFAGGGAIPLEAMRLGCDVVAADINPVAWFVLKCTLEYPQKLSGQKRRLPNFALQDREFMAEYLKAAGKSPADIKRQLRKITSSAAQWSDRDDVARGENRELLDRPDLAPDVLQADLSWHVRAWGRWILRKARKEMADFYPAYAEFCSLKTPLATPIDLKETMQIMPSNDDGEPQVDLLNEEFDTAYLSNPYNPRWVAKPTAAYLWARTVECKNCRATLPLLKTCWLAKKGNKRVLLTMSPRQDKAGVEFGIETDVVDKGGNIGQKDRNDRKIGAGTMSRAGAICPCCETIMTRDNLRMEGRAGRLGLVMTAVVVHGLRGKEYRRPEPPEIKAAEVSKEKLEQIFADVPLGVPMEPIGLYDKPYGSSDSLDMADDVDQKHTLRRLGCSRSLTVAIYGMDQWHKLFTTRQLATLGTLVCVLRELPQILEECNYGAVWREAIVAYNAMVFDKTADYSSAICTWHNSGEKIRNTFSRFALPITWDAVETAVLNDAGGGWQAQLTWVTRYIEHGLAAADDGGIAKALNQSAILEGAKEVDVIVTDPPYYNAIEYSDLMDFFYIWLRRTLQGLSPEIDEAFAAKRAPKWDHDKDDGELIDEASRFGGDKKKSKRNYEAGMARAFQACHKALKEDGRLVIAFAHKQPAAWETLVSAIIKAGFIVDGSWPIQTESGNRLRATLSAALASSVWLVCRKRKSQATGWDEQVVKDMESNITQRLRDFWDAGIRGPDFVWAATGPAMEAYSRYRVVKKASEPGAVMKVEEFLRHVRRIVVDFVIGRVLSRDKDGASAGDWQLDGVTTYYLLHRNDFGLEKAPAGACILYMLSCGVPDRDLVERNGLLVRPGGRAEDAEEGGGGYFQLKSWSKRDHSSLGEETARGQPPPLIDQVHKLLHLWESGDRNKVDGYIDHRGLRHNPIFAQLVQALIERSRREGQNDECSLLERLANYIRRLGDSAQSVMELN